MNNFNAFPLHYKVHSQHRRLATRWTVRGSNPRGDEIPANVQTDHGVQSASV